MYIFDGIKLFSVAMGFVFLLTLLLMFLALRFFPRLNLMDKPHLYGLKRKPIPYYGGLIIFISFVVSVLIFVPLTKTLIGVLLAAFLVCGISFCDDKWNLSPLIRLIVQFLAGVLLVFFGVGVLEINLPFIGVLNFSIPILASLFTILWVMTLINTTNFIDGIGGLASGVGFIGGLTMFILSVNPEVNADLVAQQPVALMALILSICCFVFFIFDFPKSQILMGDTGSTFIGFMLATLAIFSGGKMATVFLVLGLPILDLVWVVLRRTLNGQKFWKGDLKHLHHRLMELGLSERQVVIVYLSITAVLGALSVTFVNTHQKFFMIIGLVLLMVIFAGALILLPRKR